MQEILYVVIGLLIGFLIAQFLVARWYAVEKEKIIREYEGRIRKFMEERDREIEKAREASVRHSRSVLRGKVAEQVAPMLPGFDYSPTDARFLGDPIDYIVFDGYSDIRDKTIGEKELDIVILEIKSAKAALSREQRHIAKAIEEGRVRFEVVRVFDDGTVKKQAWHRKDSNM